MSGLTLVIGSKNYSSWSLRAWLLLRRFGVPFTEIKLPLDTPEFHARIGGYTPTGRVPVLLDGNVHVWDSLAIAEYVNDHFLDGRGWPPSRPARAQARAVSAEMHSGFRALRNALPFNCRKRARAGALDADAEREVERVKSLWREARTQFGGGGPFLYGEFSIADAMYAPVVLRFASYDIALGAPERAYADAVLSLPPLREWLRETEDEPIAELHEKDTP
jgi:glutathione S-transferase